MVAYCVVTEQYIYNIHTQGGAPGRSPWLTLPRNGLLSLALLISYRMPECDLMTKMKTKVMTTLELPVALSLRIYSAVDFSFDWLICYDPKLVRPRYYSTSGKLFNSKYVFVEIRNGTGVQMLPVSIPPSLSEICDARCIRLCISIGSMN
jgi:hypothetical protein